MMKYETAKAIVAQVPGLLLDPDDGKPHIVVRKEKDGHPFSIILPNCLLPPPIVAQDAVPEQPATETSPGIPARPAVAARSSEDQLVEIERKMLVDALNAALAHL